MKFTDINETIRIAGFELAVTIEPDSDSGAPWEESDGHGPVSDWTTRDKAPGELVLSHDRSAKRFYDYAEACRIARRDGWGSLWPYTLSTRYVRGAWEATATAYGKPDLIARRKDINAAIRDVYAQRRAQFPTARAYHANAAMADFDYLRRWCNNQWSYCGVIVTASRNGIELGNASLWSVEDSDRGYLLTVANELTGEALDTARASVAALTE